MNDVSIREAMLLWDSPITDKESRFVVRPLGHRDYDRYSFQVGACFRNWQQETDIDRLKLRLMIEAWHIVAFYDVPVTLVKDGLLCIPEYRDMLASDCLPERFRHERE